MMKPGEISISDFTYDLPDKKIALHPLGKRDASKLLIYKNGHIEQTVFANIAEHLPEGTLLVFNNTKVINARLTFFKSTGARIELFCLEPYEAINEYATVMSTTASVKWKCFIGGAAKWKEEIITKNIIVQNEEVVLSAKKISREGETYIIELSWAPPQHSFAAILQAAGTVPLPPYIKRLTDDEDTARYQTIFAFHEGSVAAPTAGLHFTEHIFSAMQRKNIGKEFVTLHVGAGTFKPVKATTMQGHEMHAEYIDVTVETIESLAQQNCIAAVGTTSLRTLETLYWLGVKAFLHPEQETLLLEQWDVYEAPLVSSTLAAHDALNALATWLRAHNKISVFTKTQLLIVPGYTFRMVKFLVTNFHQPQSTLLLLVAAAIGDDWKKMYDYALKNDFRFLSYGDGNLIQLKIAN